MPSIARATFHRGVGDLGSSLLSRGKEALLRKVEMKEVSSRSSLLDRQLGRLRPGDDACRESLTSSEGQGPGTPKEAKAE